MCRTLNRVWGFSANKYRIYFEISAALSPRAESARTYKDQWYTDCENNVLDLQICVFSDYIDLLRVLCLQCYFCKVIHVCSAIFAVLFVMLYCTDEFLLYCVNLQCCL